MGEMSLTLCTSPWLPEIWKNQKGYTYRTYSGINKLKKKLNNHPASVWPSTYLFVPVYGTRYKQKENQLGDATTDYAEPETLMREQQFREVTWRLSPKLCANYEQRESLAKVLL